MEKRLGHGRARSRRPMHKLSLGLAGMALGGLGDRRVAYHYCKITHNLSPYAGRLGVIAETSRSLVST